MWNDRPVREAAANGHLLVVKFLHSRDADLSACQNDALRWASIRGFLPVVQYLLENKADAEALNGETIDDSRIGRLLKR